MDGTYVVNRLFKVQMLTTANHTDDGTILHMQCTVGKSGCKYNYFHHHHFSRSNQRLPINSVVLTLESATTDQLCSFDFKISDYWSVLLFDFKISDY